MSYSPRHQPEPAPSPGSSPGEDATVPPKKNRRGSENRQREKVISVRVYDSEDATIKANAAAVDLTPCAFLRGLGTGKQRSRERRPPRLDMKMASQLVGQVGRIGGNLAQLLKLANRGEIVNNKDLAPAVQDARDFIAAARKVLQG